MAPRHSSIELQQSHCRYDRPRDTLSIELQQSYHSLSIYLIIAYNHFSFFTKLTSSHTHLLLVSSLLLRNRSKIVLIRSTTILQESHQNCKSHKQQLTLFINKLMKIILNMKSIQIINTKFALKYVY